MSEQAPVFTIEKVYLKDLSLEMPHAPQIFLQQVQPAIDVQLHNEGRALDNGLFDVVLTATVTAKVQDKTLFLVEVAQAGIFQIRNLEQPDLDMVINVTCPAVLLPYAREAVAGVMSRAGFQPVVLPHVGFEGLYQQRLQEQAQGAAAPAAPA